MICVFNARFSVLMALFSASTEASVVFTLAFSASRVAIRCKIFCNSKLVMETAPWEGALVFAGFDGPDCEMASNKSSSSTISGSTCELGARISLGEVSLGRLALRLKSRRGCVAPAFTAGALPFTVLFKAASTANLIDAS